MRNLIRRPLFLYDPNHVEAAAPAAEPVDAAAPGPVADALPDAPWASDLRQYVQDDTAYVGADRYIREKAQPRITQLEQELASSKQARELYEDLTSNPAETYLAITQQLLGDDAMEAVRAMFAEDEPEDEPGGSAPMDPRLAAIIEREEAAERQKMYDAEVARVSALEGRPELHEDLFAPFVIAAEGDFDQARNAYDQWMSRFVPAPTAEPAAAPAPPVLGNEGSATAPATATEYRSWNDLGSALDSAVDEMKRPAPPVVGLA